MKILALLICALMVAGCAGTGRMWSWHHGHSPSHLMASAKRIIPVYYDIDFTKEERHALDESLEEWRGVFNGQVEFKVDAKGFQGLAGAKRQLESIHNTGLGWVIIRMSSDNEEIQVGARTLAFAQLGGHYMVVLHDRIGTRDLKTIAMHEMGHLLGSGHTNSHGLLHPYYGPAQYDCIDKITVSEVGAALGIPLTELNYCITPNFE